MKKTLVAAAALAFIGVASAQSTVTLFGSIDAGVGVSKVKNSAAFGGAGSDKGAQVFSGQQNGSRWGMMGSEDLGGGTKAIFNLTSGFAVDTGASAQGGLLFGREAYVGLQGGFGKLTLGRQVVPQANGPYAITGGYANYDAWTSTTGATFGNKGSIADERTRQDNSIQYQTPNMGGFVATLMLAPGEDKSAAGTGRYASLGLDYANGPVAVTFAYESVRTIKPAVAAGFTFNATTGVTANVVAPASSASSNNWGLGASYDFGGMKLSGAYERGSAGTFDDKGYALGLSVPLGAISLDTEYAYEKTTNSGAYVSKAKALTLRVNYPLSKRTKVYAFVTDGTSNTNVAGAKQDLTRYMVGMRHSF